MSTASPTPTPTPAEWTKRAERGSLPLVRFMAWLSLLVGRRASRVLLRVVSAYFFITGGKARRATRAYLRRVLGREPRLAEQFDVFFSFSATIHDRVYFLKDQFDLFDIRRHGHELFDDGRGALLMGAHAGSFEVMRAAARHMAARRVAMSMYEVNARLVHQVLAAVAPKAVQDIIALGRVDSMLHLNAKLEAGYLVGILADRTLGAETTIEVNFMGTPARFPTGPMRMAAALRRPVFFMIGLYRGGNRYDIHFEPLADFSGAAPASRGEREQRVREAVERYAARLEHYCRVAPNNWFNFTDFWERP
jgi:predicted LPLAT superfamily acyltransferase